MGLGSSGGRGQTGTIGVDFQGQNERSSVFLRPEKRVGHPGNDYAQGHVGHAHPPPMASGASQLWEVPGGLITKPERDMPTPPVLAWASLSTPEL